MTGRLEDTSSFHCGTEVHLAKLHWLCLPIYLLALRLSRNSGKFVAHIAEMADHFESNRSSVWRAITDLKTSAFLVLTRSGRGDGIYECSEYKILSHREWAEQHPGQCRAKFELGFNDRAASDLLGRHLYALSGGHEIRFRAHRIHWYRKLGFSDGDIEVLFSEWFEPFAAVQVGKKWRRNADYEFGAYLALEKAYRQKVEVGS